MDVTLSFEYPNLAGEIVPHTFDKPLQVLKATMIEEVEQVLREAIAWTEKGYWAAGFVSYEAGAAFDSAIPRREDMTMPYVWFAIFDQVQHTTISSNAEHTLHNMSPSLSEEEYAEAIQSIHQQIYEGYTYQTNYTVRLHGAFSGDGKALYTQLKQAQQANYCAYLQTDEYQIISASPELFFRIDERRITTRPMKGTVPRGLTAEEDTKQAQWLYHSEKNRAENVMIVDLLRNDLGKIAKAGTVQVDELFTIEPYPTVHQMTSTVSAELESHVDLYEVFKALFPCGSITGAPKVETMSIIQRLEPSPRDVYCGAIGFITPNQHAIFNVAIRTLVVDEKQQATYGVGGGITWDSTAASEFDEVIAKAKVLSAATPQFELLETLRLEEGVFFVEQEHLERIIQSAKYFRIPIERFTLEQTLAQLKKDYPTGVWRVRLLVDQKGIVSTECFAFEDLLTPVKVRIADQPLEKNNRFLYHKTTHRSMYTAFQQKHKDVDDVLLWNEDGCITEFTNGNVVMELDGQKFTPPVSCGLLPGTFRAKLLATGEITERVLTKEDIQHATAIWFINSLRQWRAVQLVE